MARFRSAVAGAGTCAGVYSVTAFLASIHRWVSAASCHIFMNSLRFAVRQFSTMASTPLTCSPFTRAVVSSMRKLYVVTIGAPRN